MNGALPGFLQLPEHGAHIASASPNALSRRGTVPGRARCCQGTSASLPGFPCQRPRRERDDRGTWCVRPGDGLAEVGSVVVEQLMAVESYPSVPTWSAVLLRHWAPWLAGHLAATFRPAACPVPLRVPRWRSSRAWNPCPRQWALAARSGWIDAILRGLKLGVAIRTFWLDGAELKFGTGRASQHGQRPGGEWRNRTQGASPGLVLMSADSVKR